MNYQIIIFVDSSRRNKAAFNSRLINYYIFLEQNINIRNNFLALVHEDLLSFINKYCFVNVRISSDRLLAFCDINLHVYDDTRVYGACTPEVPRTYHSHSSAKHVLKFVTLFVNLNSKLNDYWK